MKNSESYLYFFPSSSPFFFFPTKQEHLLSSIRISLYLLSFLLFFYLTKHTLRVFVSTVARTRFETTIRCYNTSLICFSKVYIVWCLMKNNLFFYFLLQCKIKLLFKHPYKVKFRSGVITTYIH